MMSPPLDEQYFTWLYSQISSVRLKNPSKTWWSLARQLYTTQFVWFIPNDDNRMEDGRLLRHEFVELHDIRDPDPNWMDLGCSMLEVLIAISRRLSFEVDGEPSVWFWHLMDNIDLFKFNDLLYNEEARKEIDETLNRIIFRQYDYDGRGGLFPLRNPTQDQREVELWYQLNAYLAELF